MFMDHCWKRLLSSLVKPTEIYFSTQWFMCEIKIHSAMYFWHIFFLRWDLSVLLRMALSSLGQVILLPPMYSWNHITISNSYWLFHLPILVFLSSAGGGRVQGFAHVNMFRFLNISILSYTHSFIFGISWQIDRKLFFKMPKSNRKNNALILAEKNW